MTRTVVALACAAVLGTGCVDLEVANPNQADRERALQSASDVEALVAGSYRNWFDANTASNATNSVLMTMAYQHSATAANFGMVEFSSWPKVAAHYRPTDAFYSQVVGNEWIRYYRAVSAVVVGLQTVDEGTIDVSEIDVDRLQAYGYFVLGLAHGSAAIMFDQAYVYSPDMTVDEVELRPYPEVLQAAFGFFDRAITIAQSNSFTIPELWTANDISSGELVRLIHSYKARYRAAVARTPAERAAVDWNTVIADIDKGITEDFTWNMRQGSGWASGLAHNAFRYGPWGQLSYQVLGMADQSGQYQRWISRDPWDRHPNLSDDQLSDPFLIMTPDLRFPQGATRAEQTANDGFNFEIATAGGGFASQWARPDRGSFRWSYYRPIVFQDWASPGTNRHDWPEMRVEEMQLLKAEGLFRTGNRAAAAAIINETRVAAGLNATNADGLNTSCVPKLPDGSCGGLFEMLKWEVRLETMYAGLHFAPWYFHGRGWGDLAEGSFLQLPIPGREAELLLMEPYTFGGIGGESSAPVGTYGY